jgi:hypothetical protein
MKIGIIGAGSISRKHPSLRVVSSLHLCDAAIYKQFRSRDVAAVIRS